MRTELLNFDTHTRAEDEEKEEEEEERISIRLSSSIVRNDDICCIRLLTDAMSIRKLLEVLDETDTWFSSETDVNQILTCIRTQRHLAKKQKEKKKKNKNKPKIFKIIRVNKRATISTILSN